MRHQALPQGVVSSNITPFTADGEVDLTRVAVHIDWLIEDGAAGISPLGSSGEFTAMDYADRQRVVDASLEAVNGRVPTLVGSHHYTTKQTVALSRYAEAAGANGLLVIPPYYMLPTRRQVMNHYREIAAAVGIPVVLYYNVGNTNVRLTVDEILQLHSEGAIAGVKWSDYSAAAIFDLLEGSDHALTVYTGVDPVAFEGLCYGAHGWISGIPSIVPGAANVLYHAIAVQGDLAAARAAWTKLLPLAKFEFAGMAAGVDPHWFSVMKSALTMLIGPEMGAPQLPLDALAPDDRAYLATLLTRLGYQPRTDLV